MPKIAQQDNTHLAVKLQLRREICRMLRAPLRVLDCCAGAGTIWRILQTELNVKSYLPIDKKPQMPGTLKMDSRRALKALDLTEFNVIDIDTYGEPWEHWLTLCGRLPAKVLAVFLTHGHVTIGGGTKVGTIARQAMGIPAEWKVAHHPKIAKLSASYCLAEGCKNAIIRASRRWISPRVDYYGLLLKGRRHER